MKLLLDVLRIVWMLLNLKCLVILSIEMLAVFVELLCILAFYSLKDMISQWGWKSNREWIIMKELSKIIYKVNLFKTISIMISLIKMEICRF
jgi:hypothetical protein